MIDAVFALMILFACINGYKKGLIVASFSILAFIAGIAAALKLSSVVAARLSTNIHATGKWVPVISFVAVFLLVTLIISMTGKLVQKSVEFVMLGWVNRLGGVLLFALLYSIIFSVFLFYARQLNLFDKQSFEKAQCYIFIKPLGPAVINKLGNIIPFFKGMFNLLSDFFNKVSNKI